MRKFQESWLERTTKRDREPYKSKASQQLLYKTPHGKWEKAFPESKATPFKRRPLFGSFLPLKPLALAYNPPPALLSLWNQKKRVYFKRLESTHQLPKLPYIPNEIYNQYHSTEKESMQVKVINPVHPNVVLESWYQPLFDSLVSTWLVCVTPMSCLTWAPPERA